MIVTQLSVSNKQIITIIRQQCNYIYIHLELLVHNTQFMWCTRHSCLRCIELQNLCFLIRLDVSLYIYSGARPHACAEIQIFLVVSNNMLMFSAGSYLELILLTVNNLFQRENVRDFISNNYTVYLMHKLNAIM